MAQKVDKMLTKHQEAGVCTENRQKLRAINSYVASKILISILICQIIILAFILIRNVFMMHKTDDGPIFTVAYNTTRYLDVFRSQSQVIKRPPLNTPSLSYTPLQYTLVY